MTKQEAERFSASAGEIEVQVNFRRMIELMRKHADSSPAVNSCLYYLEHAQLHYSYAMEEAAYVVHNERLLRYTQ